MLCNVGLPAREATSPSPPQVGLDLFNFMQSFGGVQQVGADQLLVPANILNRWVCFCANSLQTPAQSVSQSGGCTGGVRYHAEMWLGEPRGD